MTPKQHMEEVDMIVVMEPGSEWPAHIADLTDVVGLAGEDLLKHTQEKVAALERRKQRVRVAVLACNSATGGETLGRRTQLARALVNAVTRSVHGRLILSASERASHALREELFTLAGALTNELRGSTASVSLWFTEPSHGPATRLAETWRPPHTAREVA
jgi:hypothetical protein